MPVRALGLRKKAWPESAGLSSSATLSSRCHSVNRPSMRLASLTLAANGRGPLAAAVAAAPLGAEAEEAGVGAADASAAALATNARPLGGTSAVTDPTVPH